MTEYYLVDVKGISSKYARSEFQENELEEIAQSILEAGGLLKPLVLKQIGPEKYEVIAGDLEYYAAIRAKEINSRAGEMVSAFIVPPSQQEAAIQQIQKLEQQNQTVPNIPAPPQSTSVSDQRINNLEARLDQAILDLKQSQNQEIKKLETELNALKNQIPQKINPLDAFNNFEISKLTYELSIRKISIKNKKQVMKIIERERKKEPFSSLASISKRVKGLGETNILNIVEAFM